MKLKLTILTKFSNVHLMVLVLGLFHLKKKERYSNINSVYQSKNQLGKVIWLTFFKICYIYKIGFFKV